MEGRFFQRRDIVRLQSIFSKRIGKAAQGNIRKGISQVP